MEVINNLRQLDELDDETAVTVIQLALQELNVLLEADQGPSQRPEESSQARRALERRRDELERHLRRRRGRTAPAVAGPSSSSSSQPAQAPVEAGPPNTQQNGQQPVQPPPESTEVGEGGQENETATHEQSPNSGYRVPGSWPESEQIEDTGHQELVPCNVCMDDFDSRNVLTLQCHHHCCRESLNEIFRGATTDESRYPPRCCEPIPFEQSQRLLEGQVAREFLEKQVEWETKDRTYCSNRGCLRFIRPENIRGKDAKCTSCRTRTCSHCKKAAHGKERCLDDEDMQGPLRVMEQNRWRRCESCGAGIERTYGCNHIS
jgi:IBR domain, a half RING-finger domain